MATLVAGSVRWPLQARRHELLDQLVQVHSRRAPRPPGRTSGLPVGQ